MASNVAVEVFGICVFGVMSSPAEPAQSVDRPSGATAVVCRQQAGWRADGAGESAQIVAVLVLGLAGALNKYCVPQLEGGGVGLRHRDRRHLEENWGLSLTQSLSAASTQSRR